MSPRSRVVALLAVPIVFLPASVAYALAAAGAGTPTVAVAKLETGKRFYRTYCGQCHALTAALAAGFGAENKFGQDGGPSFDNLRVPFNLSVQAVTTPWAGHEVISHKMTWTQVNSVAAYVELTTKRHVGLAQPIDG
jgi:mono/diheme cytochrome c family protein